MTSLLYSCRVAGQPHSVVPRLADEAAIAAMIRRTAAAPTRYSLLKRMAASPLEYLLAAGAALEADEQDETIASKLGAGPGRDRETALRFGTAVHHYVLGSPDRVVIYSEAERDARTPPKPARKGRGVAALLDPTDAEPAPAKRVTRQGAAWAAFEAEHLELGHTILLPREEAEARAMADSILRCAKACELLFDATEVEQRIDWRLRGRAIRSTPDARRPGRWVADLKTCADSSPRRFGRQIYDLQYHAQLECYRRAAEAVDGTAPEEAWIVAVDRKRPPRCYRVTEDGLELGARNLGAWIETLLTCEASAHFPFDGVLLAPPPEYLVDVELFDVPDDESDAEGVEQGTIQ